MSESIVSLIALSSDELRALAAGDEPLVRAIYGAFPDASGHAGYEEFAPAWIRRFGPQILRAVEHMGDVEAWSWEETTVAAMAIDRIASDLLAFLNLPEKSAFAASAIVLLLIRGLTRVKQGDSE